MAKHRACGGTKKGGAGFTEGGQYRERVENLPGEVMLSQQLGGGSGFADVEGSRAWQGWAHRPRSSLSSGCRHEPRARGEP